MKKNICIIVPTKLPIPSQLGGAIEFLTEVILKVNETQDAYNIHLISSHINDEKITFKSVFFYPIRYSKIRYIFRKIFRNHPSLSSFSSLKKRIRQVKNHVEVDRWIISGGEYSPVINELLKLGITDYIFYNHGSNLPGNFELKYLHNVIFVSEYSLNLWKNKFLRFGQAFNFSKINNTFNERFLEKCNIHKTKVLRDALLIPSNHSIIIFVGRIVKEKGLDVLINAINSLDNSKITLLIIGRNLFGYSKRFTKYEMNIKKLIRQSNKNIISLGFIDNSKLRDYLCLTDIAIIPSVWEEPAGIVALEYSASNLPIIAFNSGGLPEYLFKINSIILDKNSPLLISNLANTINKLLMSPPTINKVSLYEKVESFLNIKYFNELKDFINK